MAKDKTTNDKQIIKHTSSLVGLIAAFASLISAFLLEVSLNMHNKYWGLILIPLALALIAAITKVREVHINFRAKEKNTKSK